MTTEVHSPAFHYGMYLGEVGDLAGLLLAKGLVSEVDGIWNRLFQKATKTTAMGPRVAVTAMDWLRSLRVNGRSNTAISIHDRMDDAMVAMGQWDGWLKQRHLTTGEQADVMLGYSRALRNNRLRRRQNRITPGKA